MFFRNIVQTLLFLHICKTVDIVKKKKKGMKHKQSENWIGWKQTSILEKPKTHFLQVWATVLTVVVYAVLLRSEGL